MSQIKNKPAVSDVHLTQIVEINVVAVLLAVGIVHAIIPETAMSTQLWVGFLAGSTVVWATTMVIGAILIAYQTAKTSLQGQETENYSLQKSTEMPKKAA